MEYFRKVLPSLRADQTDRPVGFARSVLLQVFGVDPSTDPALLKQGAGCTDRDRILDTFESLIFAAVGKIVFGPE